MYGFHELKLRPFLNTLIRPGIIRCGMKLRLLTETLTGTLVELTLGRIRKFIPPPWYKRGEVGGWNPSPEFLISGLQYFETILPLVEKPLIFLTR